VADAVGHIDFAASRSERQSRKMHQLAGGAADFRQRRHVPISFFSAMISVAAIPQRISFLAAMIRGIIIPIKNRKRWESVKASEILISSCVEPD
jgi:hypothetical protein